MTPSQIAAVDQIAGDVTGEAPMQRLMVGDVGSGKTAVALAAAAMIGAAGGQTLMMVPTEVLAEQQARALRSLAAGLGLSVEVLTGSTPAAARAATLRACAAGEVSILIGTQALLSQELALPRLGLVVVDEQHRFGVAERSRLGRRGGAESPHLLAMSATPIPRSLALALHGDLDASFLTERPAGRAAAGAIAVTNAGERTAAYARLADEISRGRQGFVVCPVRERARRSNAITAIGHFGRLRRELAPARVGLLHGALDARTKEATLRAFAGGELDVLVATTVVELGIDVPNATVMIIEEADRFGLAQLHQLRGRVGRGDAPGVCFLCASSEAITVGGDERLRLVSEIDDGFRLAEADLEQRGFGDLFGTRQAGLAEEGDTASWLELTAVARRQAEILLAEDPKIELPEHDALARAARARVETLFAGESG
jgi:ATP-dependent DNA helicase RecG